MLIINRHIEIWFQIPRRLGTLIYLIDYGVVIAKNLNSAVFEQMRIQFDELEQGQQAGVFTLLVVSLELGSESDSDIGDGETDETVKPGRVIIVSVVAEKEAFHISP
jgi:hypothetical protein